MSATSPTVDELRERIASYEREIAEAEQDAGAALRAGKPTGPALKRADQAHGAIKAARAAIEQLSSDEAQAAERAQQEAASQQRRIEYEYVAEVAERAEAVLVAREAARAAEDRLLELHGHQGARRIEIVRSGMRSLDQTSIDLDADVLVGCPKVPRPSRPGHAREPLSFGRLTIESLRATRELAERRAAEEEAGEGRDFSGIDSTRAREGREAHERRRAEAKAAREAQEAAENSRPMPPASESRLTRVS